MTERVELTDSVRIIAIAPLNCVGSLFGAMQPDDPPERQFWFGDVEARIIVDRRIFPCADDDEQVLGRWVGVCLQPVNNPKCQVTGTWATGDGGVQNGVVAISQAKLLLTDKYLRCSMRTASRYRSEGRWHKQKSGFIQCIFPLAEVNLVTGCRTEAQISNGVEAFSASQVANADANFDHKLNDKMAGSELAIALTGAIIRATNKSEDPAERAGAARVAVEDFGSKFRKRTPQRVDFR